MHTFGQRPTMKQEARRFEELANMYQKKLAQAIEAVQFLAKIIDEHKIDPLKYKLKLEEIFKDNIDAKDIGV